MGNSNTLATWCEELTHWKRPCCWERLRAGGEGDDRDEMVGCHHRLNGHEFGQTPGVGDGQGGLVCCSSWGRKESDMTEQLNWTEALGVSDGQEGLACCSPWGCKESDMTGQLNWTELNNQLWNLVYHIVPQGLPCTSPTPGVHSNPCTLSWWCHPTILSSVFPFSSCPQSFSASGSFQMSQLFALGGQSIGVSASMLIFVNDSFEFAIT